MKIKNINEKYGESVTFEGADLPDCIVAMATAIVDCGDEVADGQTVNDLCYSLRDGVDYEVCHG